MVGKPLARALRSIDELRIYADEQRSPSDGNASRVETSRLFRSGGGRRPPRERTSVVGIASTRRPQWCLRFPPRSSTLPRFARPDRNAIVCDVKTTPRLRARPLRDRGSMRALPLNDPRESALIRDSCLETRASRPSVMARTAGVRVKCGLRHSHAEAIHRSYDGCCRSDISHCRRSLRERLTARTSKPHRRRFLPRPVHSPLRSSARAASPAPSSRWRRASRSPRRGSRYTVSGSQGMLDDRDGRTGPLCIQRVAGGTLQRPRDREGFLRVSYGQRRAGWRRTAIFARRRRAADHRSAAAAPQRDCRTCSRLAWESPRRGVRARDAIQP